jgi:FkbM family methyltransferase
MFAPVDDSPYGARAPRALDRAVLAATERLPDTRFALRLAMGLRRVAPARGAGRPLDVTRFGARVRLYPAGNGCEKSALFTPRMYDPRERAWLGGIVAAARAAGRPFAFVDVGANVGLYALAVAAAAGGTARVLAIEPQPGIAGRLAANIAANPGFDVRPIAVAVGEREGEAEFFVDPGDYGVSRIGGRGMGEAVTVRTRRLAALLAEEGFTGADALKLDCQGLEDVVLEGFLAATPDADLPGALLVKDNRRFWTRDALGMLAARGYAAAEGAGGVVLLRRP